MPINIHWISTYLCIPSCNLILVSFVRVLLAHTEILMNIFIMCVPLHDITHIYDRISSFPVEINSCTLVVQFFTVCFHTTPLVCFYQSNVISSWLQLYAVKDATCTSYHDLVVMLIKPNRVVRVSFY